MRAKVSSILWGLLFIAVGVGYIGNQFFHWGFALFFPGWWAALIAVFFLISMVRSGIRFYNVLGVLIGALLLAHYQGWIPSEIKVYQLIWPTVFIVVGIEILFHCLVTRKKAEIPKFATKNAARYTAVFSGQEARVPPIDFEGAELTAVFGGVELDLRQAVITKDVAISCNCIFGGIDLMVPPNVQVKLSVVPIFGGAENKANTAAESSMPTIYIEGMCLFGGIEVK